MTVQDLAAWIVILWAAKRAIYGVLDCAAYVKRNWPK